MFLLNTTIDDSSPLISYAPVEGWKAYGPDDLDGLNSTGYYQGSFTSTWNVNAFATFQFNGTSLSIFGGKRKAYGNFTVTLDDVNFTLSSYSPNVQDSPSLLFNAQVQQGWHKVKISNDGTTGFDIDSISWTSGMGNASSSSDPSSFDNSPPSITYTDDMSEFSWAPAAAWRRNSESSNGRTTSSVGASMNFTFEHYLRSSPICQNNQSDFLGQAISLSGPIGPNFTSSYSVALDGSTPRAFSANRITSTAILYYADNLGPGEHTVTIINHGVSNATDITRRTTDSNTQNCFGIYQAQVWKGEEVVTPTSNDTNVEISTGAIVGISIGSVAFVALLVLLLLLNRRNKTLWARLQKGYMVQSQFDPSGALTRPSTPPMTYNGIQQFHTRELTIEPFVESRDISQSFAHPTNKRDETGNTKYQPYAGFGLSRSERHTASASVTNSNSGNGDHEQQQDPTPFHPPQPLFLPTLPTSMTPSRSETLLSVSTLVAEDGREPITDDIDTAVDSSKPLLKVIPGWRIITPGVQRGAHNATTPTTNSYVSEPDVAFQLLPPIRTPKTPTTPETRSMLLGTRRNTHHPVSHSSRFSRQRRSQIRSLSPSRTSLLHNQNGALAQEERYNEDEDSADYYVLHAQGMVDMLRFSTVSIQRSQSDAQTPILGRVEDEQYGYDSDFSRVQIPAWLSESGNISFPRMSSPAPIFRSDSDILDPSPRREDSKDTLPPIYTSRSPTVDLPPPFLTR
ncbi:MAG: hypothetical protein NXY57DRAFT_1088163 [Lentinula lateritia]|nr:MAG: hypothetical protein NXY57DRAFT_1088163 [Lentinula lateritia]